MRPLLLISWRAAAPFAFLLLASCGYVGPVQPPSPEIPATIADLAAIERGDKILVTFTSPPRTTDGVAITRFSHIELRVGLEGRADSVKTFEIEPPEPGEKQDPQPQPVNYALNVAEWTGQRISLSVQTAVKKNGHFSSWSNKAVVNVVPPIATPVVQAAASPKGILLTWPASNASQYRIERQGPADKQPIELASVAGTEYTDISAAYDTAYRYIVTAKKDGAESLPSEAIQFSFIDKYAPANPSGLTALIGPDAIDLAWQRNGESDLHGYYIYRSVDSGPFQRLGQMVPLPTATDKAVEHGRTYAYRISAIDRNNNESGLSNIAEVSF